ncbi:AAA family ATPase [Ignavigranum ruoffiae]
MGLLNARKVKRFENWTVLVYSEPGKGKTTMVKSLKGKTILLSVDGMYTVLAGLDNVDIYTMDSKKPNKEIGEFYKFVRSHLDDYNNIVIDNLSTLQKIWLNEAARSTKSGMPELKDYPIFDRVLLDFINSLKDFNKNLLLLAHEISVEITRTNGGVYTQFQPEFRNLNAIMGVIPLVGRLVVYTNQTTNEHERIIVLQPTQATKAKDQLIGNIDTIPQMELLPTLQKGE